MNKQSILLISHGLFEKDFLEKIATEVAREFLLAVNIEESHIDMSEFYDPNRRQYDGNKLLIEIDSMPSSEIVKKVGLFRVDLFIPILTYIFGQAAFKGSTGIASLYRLRNEQYGMKKDDTLLLNRFAKVVIHELGHTFGLIHCHIPTCVMRSSTYVEDIDQKDIHFCLRCQTELKRKQMERKKYYKGK
ncbi:MAG: archaemetzincin family Zn-dependent metalloprotease [Bacteroidetes bacterium]|nr:archaemetzincin family Zn-dependent metalloprotease [Bacteroidota bacterium]MBL6944189.1 archaemetzincin family Zn-dependent metalloprotease [Bacteroidales bacterium]